MKSYILLLTFIAIACAVMVHADDDDDDDDDDDNGLSFRPIHGCYPRCHKYASCNYRKNRCKCFRGFFGDGRRFCIPRCRPRCKYGKVCKVVRRRPTCVCPPGRLCIRPIPTCPPPLVWVKGHCVLRCRPHCRYGKVCKIVNHRPTCVCSRGRKCFPSGCPYPCHKKAHCVNRRCQCKRGYYGDGRRVCKRCRFPRRWVNGKCRSIYH